MRMFSDMFVYKTQVMPGLLWYSTLPFQNTDCTEWQVGVVLLALSKNVTSLGQYEEMISNQIGFMYFQTTHCRLQERCTAIFHL